MERLIDLLRRIMPAINRNDDMTNFTTDELRYIRGMAGNLYHIHSKNDKEKALIYKTI